MSPVPRSVLSSTRRLLVLRQPVPYPLRTLSTTRSLASDRPKSTEGLKPKILSTNPPQESEQDEAVKKHNAEVDQRHDKAVSQVATDDTAKDKEGEGKKDERGAKDGQGKERKEVS